MWSSSERLRSGEQPVSTSVLVFMTVLSDRSRYCRRLSNVDDRSGKACGGAIEASTSVYIEAGRGMGVFLKIKKLKLPARISQMCQAAIFLHNLHSVECHPKACGYTKAIHIPASHSRHLRKSLVSGAWQTHQAHPIAGPRVTLVLVRTTTTSATLRLLKHHASRPAQGPGLILSTTAALPSSGSLPANAVRSPQPPHPSHRTSTSSDSRPTHSSQRPRRHRRS